MTRKPRDCDGQVNVAMAWKRTRTLDSASSSLPTVHERPPDRDMLNPRPANTLSYLQRKRRLIATELGDTIESVFDYGEHDPLEVPLAACDACGGHPHQRKVQDDPLRWQVHCEGCGKHHREAHKRPWLAALAWNQINLGTQNYRRFPLFGIATLPPIEARNRLVEVRRELELRRNLTGINRRIQGELGRRPPGKQYRLRLEAYLAWAVLALRLVKADRTG